MNAKYTVLTHISARYGKTIEMDNIKEKNVGISYDFMYLCPENLHHLELVKKYNKILFWEGLAKNMDRRLKKISKNLYSKRN